MTSDLNIPMLIFMHYIGGVGHIVPSWVHWVLSIVKGKICTLYMYIIYIDIKISFHFKTTFNLGPHFSGWTYGLEMQGPLYPSILTAVVYAELQPWTGAV